MLKTKFKNLFSQNDFKYKNNLQLLLKKFSARAKQMPSKVLFAARKSDDRTGSVIARQNCNRWQQ